jgi:hypothetical protein
MGRKALWIFVLLCFLPFVVGQAVPSAPADVDAVLMQKITQEHQNTRKFFSDELTRQRTEFYTQFDDRATFYEKEFFNTINTAVLKLSLIWGAIVFFVIGLNSLMRITLEKKRWRRVKETIKDELKAEMFLRNPPQPQARQSTIFEQKAANTAAYSYQAPPIYQTPIKDGFWARRKKRKIAREIDEIEREQAKQQSRAAILRQKMGGAPVPPQPQYAMPVAPAPSPPPYYQPPQPYAPPQQSPPQVPPIAPQAIPTPPQDLKVEVYH